MSCLKVKTHICKLHQNGNVISSNSSRTPNGFFLMSLAKTRLMTSPGKRATRLVSWCIRMVHSMPVKFPERCSWNRSGFPSFSPQKKESGQDSPWPRTMAAGHLSLKRSSKGFNLATDVEVRSADMIWYIDMSKNTIIDVYIYITWCIYIYVYIYITWYIHIYGFQHILIWYYITIQCRVKKTCWKQGRSINHKTLWDTPLDVHPTNRIRGLQVARAAGAKVSNIEHYRNQFAYRNSHRIHGAGIFNYITGWSLGSIHGNSWWVGKKWIEMKWNAWNE